MLEKIDLTKSLKKKGVQKANGEAGIKDCVFAAGTKNLGVPVMIVFEGFGAAGKGTQINRLIQALDRGIYSVLNGCGNKR